MKQGLQRFVSELFSKRHLNPKKSKKRYVFYICVPMLALLFYFVLSVVMTAVTKNSMVGQAVANGIVILAGLFCTRISLELSKRENKYESFKPAAWSVFLLICMTILLWFFTQVMAACVEASIQNTGIDSYNNVASQNMNLYLITAVCISPFAEEFVFRGFMYNVWKKTLNPIAAGVLSACLFALIHGTLVHLPVAFLMGFFNAMIYEVTKQIRYPMMCHFLYNFYSVSAIIPLTGGIAGKVMISPAFNVVAFIVVSGLIVVGYLKREQIRKFVTGKHMIDYLNRKWDDDGEWYDGKKIDK